MLEKQAQRQATTQTDDCTHKHNVIIKYQLAISRRQ